jgi:hypothetical protein
MFIKEFYDKLILRKAIGTCNLHIKDREGTVYRLLNGCDRMVGGYAVRYKLIFDRLFQAMKLNCHIIEEVHENKSVYISVS